MQAAPVLAARSPRSAELFPARRVGRPMTIQRRGTARWDGDLDHGDGNVSTESGALDTTYDRASRFADGNNTNPEELIGAAHAACYSMALVKRMSEAGFEPDNVETDATVELDGEQPRILGVHLATRGRADEIDEERFQQLAREAKDACLVSGALGTLDIDVDATLETPTPG